MMDVILEFGVGGSGLRVKGDIWLCMMYVDVE